MDYSRMDRDICDDSCRLTAEHMPIEVQDSCNCRAALRVLLSPAQSCSYIQNCQYSNFEVASEAKSVQILFFQRQLQ